MNETPAVKNPKSSFTKILLILAGIIFLSIGSYSVYKIVTSSKNPKDNVVSQVFETAPANEEPVLTFAPSPTLQTVNQINITLIPTVFPTAFVTKFPTITLKPTLTPSITASPTSIPTQSSSISVHPTSTITLPVSGYSAPTILLFSIGIILILPVILL